jgi:hypothetical protein
MNGHTLYRDIWLAQIPPTLEFFSSLIKSNNFSQIIEIGTNRGGLSIYVNDIKDPKTQFVTYDITAQYLKFSPSKENIDFRVGDCFSQKFEEIKNLISQSGQTLLLCDGGNKIQEFALFSSYLKTGDVIMCHDFMDDFETYSNAQSKYNWQTAPESSMREIQDSVKQNNLSPYMFDQAKNSIWGCFKKN